MRHDVLDAGDRGACGPRSRCGAAPGRSVHSSGWKKPRRPSEVQLSENSCSSTKRRSSRQYAASAQTTIADLERHEARRPQLEVFADQAHRLEVRGDLRRAAAPRARSCPSGSMVDAHRAPAAGPGVARDRARDARHFLGAPHVVGQRDRAQLARAVGLGRVAADLLGRLRIAAVGDVERIPHAARPRR